MSISPPRLNIGSNPFIVRHRQEDFPVVAGGIIRRFYVHRTDLPAVLTPVKITSSSNMGVVESGIRKALGRSNLPSHRFPCGSVFSFWELLYSCFYASPFLALRAPSPGHFGHGPRCCPGKVQPFRGVCDCAESESTDYLYDEQSGGPFPIPSSERNLQTIVAELWFKVSLISRWYSKGPCFDRDGNPVVFRCVRKTRAAPDLGQTFLARLNKEQRVGWAGSSQGWADLHRRGRGPARPGFHRWDRP